MTGYDQIPATVEQMIDAAIEADMHWNGFEGSVSSGFSNNGGYITISPPGPGRTSGGDATDIDGVAVPPDQLTDGNRTPGWNVLTQVYEFWQTTLRDLFAPWERLPDPAATSAPLAAAARAARALTEQASWSPPTGTGDSGSVHYYNAKLSCFGLLPTRLDELGGLTIQAFNENYASRLPGIVSSNCALVQIVVFGLAVEHSAWTTARRDVATLADQALAAFARSKSTFPDSGDGSGGATLQTLGGVLDVASLIPGPQEPVVAGVRTAVGVASTVVGLIAPFLHQDAKVQPAPVPLGAPDPRTVLANLQAAFDKLNDGIRQHEDQADRALSTALGQTYRAGLRGQFDLRSPVRLIDETDPDRIVPDTVVVSPHIIHWLAETALADIAAAFADAAADLRHLGGSSGWSRDASIGLGAEGHLPHLRALADRIQDLTRDTAWEVRQAAVRLRAFEGDMQHHDDIVAARLRKLTRRAQNGSGIDLAPPPVPPPSHMHFPGETDF